MGKRWFQGKWFQLFAVLSAFALLATACPADDDDVAAEGLVIGRILPETGDLAFLGPPQIEAVRLAIEDINDAGGVLGADVRLIEADESDEAAVVRGSADDLIAQGVHAIVGAAASGQSGEIIGTLRDNQIVQCSASNTAPGLPEQSEFYFRTAPPDEGQAPIMADTVIGDDHTQVVILARADDYGRGLADLTEAALEAAGATVLEKIIYDPTPPHTAEVEQTIAANPDAVILISFEEGKGILSGLVEAGFETGQLYGADGMRADDLWEDVDPDNPAVLEGMKGTAPSARLEFNERLVERPGVGRNTIFGGQAYDCVVAVALAAASAGTTDPAVFVDHMVSISRDGTPCESFAECMELLEQGEDIDYDGASGPIEWDEVGEPSFATYEVWQIDAEGAPIQIEDHAWQIE